MDYNIENEVLFNDNFCYSCKNEYIHRYYLCENCLKFLYNYEYEFEETKKTNKNVYYVYKSVIKNLIQRFKFKDETYLVYVLGELLYFKLDKNILKDIDYITFVPMTKKKFRSRGYNQSRLIAEYIGEKSQKKVTKIIEKIKNTKEQHFLNEEERKENLKGVFKIVEEISQKKVLVIDDVHTSGVTLKECEKEILKAGATFVWSVAICG